MANAVLTHLVREVARDVTVQARSEALLDSDLAALGLSTDEVRLVPDGSLAMVVRLGGMPDVDAPVTSCGG